MPGCSGSGRLLPGFALLCGLAACPAGGRAAPDQAPTPDTQRPALDTALSRTTDPAQAAILAARIEALRLSRLSPTEQLLLRRSQRELAAGRLRDALDDGDDAVAMQPDQGVAWRGRAAVRAARGDSTGAVVDLGVALSRDPADIEAWGLLSRIEEGRGRAAAAFEAWEHVLRLDPAIEGGAARLRLLHRQLVGAPS